MTRFYKQESFINWLSEYSTGPSRSINQTNRPFELILAGFNCTYIPVAIKLIFFHGDYDTHWDCQSSGTLLFSNHHLPNHLLTTLFQCSFSFTFRLFLTFSYKYKYTSFSFLHHLGAIQLASYSSSTCPIYHGSGFFQPKFKDSLRNGCLRPPWLGPCATTLA